jgi:hypothetical protein
LSSKLSVSAAALVHVTADVADADVGVALSGETCRLVQRSRRAAVTSSRVKSDGQSAVLVSHLVSRALSVTALSVGQCGCRELVTLEVCRPIGHRSFGHCHSVSWSHSVGQGWRELVAHSLLSFGHCHSVCCHSVCCQSVTPSVHRCMPEQCFCAIVSHNQSG